MNKKIVKQIFPKMVKKVENGLCPICSQKIDLTEFEDNLSLKEFKISGLCQKCQNKVFDK